MQEQINSLNDRLSALEKEIQSLKQKHDGLINYLVKNPTQPTASASASGTSQAAPAAAQTTPTDAKFDPAKAQAASVSQSFISSAHILPLVAVICFVLAGVFIVKLAIESGWLTPERQLGLASLLGAALVGCGRFLEIIETGYRSYLSAAGIIVLYICAYASSMYFQVLSPEVSITFAGLVSVGCLGLFHYHRSELFPVIASIGTYITPLLIGNRQDLILDSGFFLIWSAVFASVSVYLRTRTLTLTASYFALGVYTLINGNIIADYDLMMVIVVQTFQFIFFAYGLYAYSIKHKEPISEKLAMAHLPILLFFYGTTYYFMNKLNAEIAPWVSLGFAGLLYLLFRNAKSRLKSLESEGLIFGFLSVVLFHSGYLQILPAETKPWLLPTILLLSYLSSAKNLLPKTSKYLKMVFTAIGLIEFIKISFALVSTASVMTVLPAAATVFVGFFAYIRGQKLVQDKSHLFLGALHILTVLALYRLAFDYGTFAVSLCWGLYSGIILAIGYQKRDPILAKSSLLVLLVTSIKALIYDASQAPSGVRIFSLILTGVVLYGAGLILKKINAFTAKSA